MEPIRVLVVDDHAIVRMGLSALFETQTDIVLAGAAEDGAEAVRKAKRLRPDIVVMDIMMPVMDGVAATREIVAENPSAKVIVLTTSASSDEIAKALEAGAAGAILKSEANRRLLATIRSVARGNRVLSQETTAMLSKDPPVERLSPRQFEILQSLARGLTNAEIATELGISSESVKEYVNYLFQKLGAANRAEAVSLAYRKHLLPT